MARYTAYAVAAAFTLMLSTSTVLPYRLLNPFEKVFYRSEKTTTHKEIPQGIQIGVIQIRGGIGKSHEIALQIRSLAKDDEVKAVLVLIDSPGGTAGHSYAIFSELLHCKKHKPVIAYIEDAGCSGSYLAACGASSIIASGGANVGSIGVLFGPNYRIIPSHYNDGHFAGDVEYDPIVAGRFKDVFNQNRELTSEDRQYLQQEADKSYDMFCQTVSEQRGLDINERESWADGKIFNAIEARDRGLIDSVGSLTDALAQVGKTLAHRGISTDKELVLVFLEQKSDREEEGSKE